MIGAVLIALGLVVVLPLLFWAGIAVLGWVASLVMTDNAEATHEGSELIATNT